MLHELTPTLPRQDLWAWAHRTGDDIIMSVPRITKEDLKARLDDETAHDPIIMDVRLKYPYEHSTLTLPGAVRVDPEAMDTTGLSSDSDIVTYDSDPEELVSAKAAATLIRRGYRASALEGGLPDWITAKFPTDTKEAPKQAPPKAGGLKG